MRGLTLLIGLALLAWLLGGAWWLNENYDRMDCFGFGNGGKNTVTTESVPKVQPTPTPKPTPPPASKAAFTIQDGTTFKTQAVDGLTFDLSGNEATVPNSTLATFRELNTYLAKNPNKRLVVQGRYGTQEENTTKFLSLGMARAADIKDRLVSLGADATQIELADKRIPNLELGAKEGKELVLNGIRFRFSEKAVTNSEEELAALKARIEANPAIIYFVTNGTNVNITPETERNIESIKTYLNSVPNAKINVTGHTDNVGKRTSNVNLSQRRAEQVKQYLVRRGFSQTQLVASGKGPDQPATTNDTAEGRAKNRRVEIGL